MGYGWGESGYMRILANPTGNGVLGLNLKPQIPQTNNFTEGSGAITISSVTTQLAVALLALTLSF